MVNCWTGIGAQEKNEGKGIERDGGEEGVDILERMKAEPHWRATLI